MTAYFLCPDYDVPAGGVRVIYRHVDYLNNAGIEASVLHQNPGFRCSWFRHDTAVRYVRETPIRDSDLLVASELDVTNLAAMGNPEARPPDVIFNQNCHCTWTRPGIDPTSYYDQAKIVLTVSDHSARVLRRAFPMAKIGHIRPGIDPELFHANDPKRDIITWMPRRGSGDATQVFALARIPGWTIEAIDGLSHEEAAARLRQSRIFLSFAYQEGFGLPVAEAMAAGNYVVGYDGFGGKELMLESICSSVRTGDVEEFALRVEWASRVPNPSAFATTASRFIHDHYSIDQERQEVVDLYRQLASLC